ncbi:MAG TPA: hypothetical protein DD473_25315 [Planctomycetaceae bacterium]|nr:hypothetical protein [Planctomycetaceae bacterium]
MGTGQYALIENVKQSGAKRQDGRGRFGNGVQFMISRLAKTLFRRVTVFETSPHPSLYAECATHRIL